MHKYLYIIIAAIIAIGLGMMMRGYSVDVVEELRGGRGRGGFGRHGGFGHGGYYGGYGGRGGYYGGYGHRGYGGRSVNYVPIFWGDYENYYYPEDQYYYYVGDPRPVPQVVSEYPFHQLFA